MKMLLIQILIISSLNSCSSEMNNTIWEIYNVSKEIKDDKIEDTFAIDYLINKKFEGTKLFIEKKKIKISGNFNMEGDISKITSKVIFVEDKGQKFQIHYLLSSDKQDCQFILADGTKLHARKKDKN